MKKTAFVTLAALVASVSLSGAQTFDLNAMPLGQFPLATDASPTGSIGAQLKKRVIVRDGVSVAQFYTLDADGKIIIVSEGSN